MGSMEKKEKKARIHDDFTYELDWLSGRYRESTIYNDEHLVDAGYHNLYGYQDIMRDFDNKYSETYYLKNEDLLGFWERKIDSVFAESFFKDTKHDLDASFPVSELGRSCAYCNELFRVGGQLSQEELRCAGNQCRVCKFLYENIASMDIKSSKWTKLSRKGSYLEIDTLYPRIYSLLRHPVVGESDSVENAHIQVGLPNLHSDYAMYFRLLREWLKDCDKSHDCMRSAVTQHWPTRVIFVGHGHSDNLKLVELKSRVNYIALSHCWGRPKEEKADIQTNRSNYLDRLRSFPLSKMPKTFQDAISVARELGIQYLWIDSLCIIQGPDGDWSTEAERMQDVFNSAYCTIAASSSAGWDEGFLEQHFKDATVSVKDSSGNIFHILRSLDDFDTDVDKAILNKRGWVLQERVLSRRIIHFTKRYTYWECGEGVRCDNFAKMTCPPGRHKFLLDPAFPARLHSSTFARSVDFLQFLFERYSICGLTYKGDREIAISSLIKRLSSVSTSMGDYGPCKHGTFDVFLHRHLLWRRSNEELPGNVHRDYRDQIIPSWSWMSVSGIQFQRVRNIKLAQMGLEGLEGLDDDFRPLALPVQVRELQDCEFEHRYNNVYRILGTGTVVNRDIWGESRAGDIWLDTETTAQFKLCVVIAMQDEETGDYPTEIYHILIVNEVSPGLYKRIGVGIVGTEHVCLEFQKGRLE